jgi:hypothetical protein
MDGVEFGGGGAALRFPVGSQPKHIQIPSSGVKVREHV